MNAPKMIAEVGSRYRRGGMVRRIGSGFCVASTDAGVDIWCGERLPTSVNAYGKCRDCGIVADQTLFVFDITLLARHRLAPMYSGLP